MSWRELLAVVGAVGFEPTTPASRTLCATRLRYAPIFLEHYICKPIRSKGAAGEIQTEQIKDYRFIYGAR